MKRTLEITSISAENIRLNKKPVKNAVVAVRVELGHECSTKPAPDKGTNPRWNENLIVDLPLHAGFITVEVKCKSSSGSYKLVSGATVPVSDFAGDLGAPHGHVRFLSYTLRDSHGVRTDGVINISVKMAGPAPAQAHTYEVPQPQIVVPVGHPRNMMAAGGLVTGVPVGHPRNMMAAGGLVAGVPVRYAQPCKC